MMRAGLWLLLFITSIPAHSGLLDGLGGSDDFLPVERAFPLDVASDKSKVNARWNSADGYYLYEHRIYLTQGAVRLDPATWSKDGKEKYDEAFGDIVAYYGELEVSFDTASLTPGTATLHYQGCADAGLCYPPQTSEVVITDPIANPIANPITDAASTGDSAISSSQSSASSDDSFFSGRSLPAVIGIFFLLGLGLTFTPCVLPMVPILTSVVLGGGKTSAGRGFWLSFLYVTGMAITYAAAGLTVGLLGAGANVQAMMQSPPVLIGFAIFFIVLSLSMFGVYELQLPSGIRNRLNAASQKQSGGQAGSVFIIGVLSALVVSPCVSAPLAGALAYLSTTGDATSGALALLALGFGMGTPLIVLGTTGASVLPKAGMWMERIKYLFGIMLIGVAIWLVSRLLPGYIVLGLWGALAVGAGVSAGALNTASEGPQRLIKPVAVGVFAYGIIALAGAVSGRSDPLNPLGHAEEVHVSPFYQTESVAEVKSLIADAHTPVMVDLYADWCISCKIMDKEIFATDEAQQRLSHVQWIQLDVTDNTDEHQTFMKAQAVFGPPTVLFFEPGADNASGRIIGERGKEEFLAEAERLVP
ncbi:thiol:disulfide interchange protein DsbD [Thalassolituus maritimus]|uniref:Thiol:disulfide interchange protein DsbD n=1 Tax=Thalassolituus maritimus TaxID=484498 RepID=A0A1N7IW13_9GAMM|nr:protein-disulfide reductase DsbD [Thalassolituus maritimus]SIS41269.1 thiol:disulfide interchange protein DsbD [Thalassolituus maritimus]